MNWERINTLRRFLRIGWIKTAYLNFSLLPFSQACRFPIIVSKYTYIYSLSGRLNITAPIRFGMIRFGFLGEDVVVPRNERGLIQLEGQLICGDNVRFGCGVILRVEPNATMIAEDDVRIGSKTRIITYDSIKIGKNTGISWECQIMDSNMHDITELSTGQIIPQSMKVDIGSNNWIGAKVNIMKGCRTPDFTIISSGSLCNKGYDVPKYSILAGVPAKIIKTGYVRSDYMKRQKSEVINIL